MTLTVSHLAYNHPDRPALIADANLVIEPGSIVGLTGPSGAGKSTFGALLAGDLAPSSGRMSIDGQPLPKRGARPVQLIHQHPDHAVNPRWRMRSVLRESHPPTPELLHRVGIREDWLDRFPDELSGGELQRFCIARALHPRTRYLIADEITAMFDAVTQAEIWDMLLNAVQQTGLGMLVISHEQALLDRICDQQVSMASFS
ncbi:MAG: ATP-binding cassette domain-containing protein [Microbacterium sp.]